MKYLLPILSILLFAACDFSPTTETLESSSEYEITSFTPLSGIEVLNLAVVRDSTEGRVAVSAYLDANRKARVSLSKAGDDIVARQLMQIVKDDTVVYETESFYEIRYSEFYGDGKALLEVEVAHGDIPLPSNQAYQANFSLEIIPAISRDSLRRWYLHQGDTLTTYLGMDSLYASYLQKQTVFWEVKGSCEFLLPQRYAFSLHFYDFNGIKEHSDVTVLGFGKGRADAYCVTKIGAQRHKTPTFRNQKERVAHFVLSPFVASNHQVIEYDVWDKDALTRDDYLFGDGFSLPQISKDTLQPSPVRGVKVAAEMKGKLDDLPNVMQWLRLNNKQLKEHKPKFD